MRCFVGLLLLLISTSVIAQLEVNTSYFNSQWERCERGDAVYYQKITLQDKRYYVKQGYVNGQVLMEGQFLDYALTEEQDTFIVYHANGNIKEKGAYEAGKKAGIWLGWFEDGKKDFKCTYKADSTSKCAYFHYNGMLSAIEEYKNDTQLISGTLWDSTGVISANRYLNIQPMFNGREDGWRSYFAEHMRFPEDDQGNRLYGDIEFFVLIDKEGNVTWGDVIGFANPHMALAIERIIKKMPKWSPAIIHNRCEAMKLRLGFTFME